MNDALPGADLIDAGIKDLREGRETIPALLVAITESDEILRSLPQLKERLHVNFHRYPALDKKSFRRAVEQAVRDFRSSVKSSQ